MRQLELLAPARDIQIGIAAIDCGADAVYIAGPQFGARQAAGNEIGDIRKLCEHAHKFGARIFVTLNTILYDDELEAAYRQMLALQDAGADALIVQDMAIVEMARKGIGDLKGDISIPLHASTQCAIRTPEHAIWLESLGFSRLILERQLSIEEIRAIRNAVSCELEFFVHGALCVCYSGQCYLSEMISGRSANRGACIQACRSRYDLVDSSGKVIVRDKALLSLKDYNLRNRIEELAQAGITSFKIEGRLKNESYVRNVVRDYSLALDRIVENNQDIYVRGSFGKVSGGFVPDTAKTFNRGYTELFLDGRRGRWASMEAAKSMGEPVGTVSEIRKGEIRIKAAKGVTLNNGDGFSFVSRNGKIEGFRGDVCTGNIIRCKDVPGMFVGASLYRNINSAFEKEIERQACVREIRVCADLVFRHDEDRWILEASAVSEDGREVTLSFDAGDQKADNQERMSGIIASQIEKSVGRYRFRLASLISPQGLPFMPASALNTVRRTLAESIDAIPCNARPLLVRTPVVTGAEFPDNKASYRQNISNRLSEAVYRRSGVTETEEAYELSHKEGAELMRTRYCIRHELGLCPVHQGARNSGPLFLINNGRKLALHFDCRRCEMTVTQVSTPTLQK
ncbi:MAG: U32 family peptidase [Bacteroidales bacterium]|nr:U32 family peptidase [Bacteroidales bacterium]